MIVLPILREPFDLDQLNLMLHKMLLMRKTLKFFVLMLFFLFFLFKVEEAFFHCWSLIL